MKTLNSYILVILFLTVSPFISISAHAELFGVSINDGEVSSELYHVNPLNADLTFIGEAGFEVCRGLDFHPVTNVLYAVCRRIDESDQVLAILDLNNGTGEEVGSLNNEDGGGSSVSDISFRSDGVLFAYNNSKLGDSLGTIDLSTGEYTVIGKTGFSGGFPGIAFSLDDILFYAGSDTMSGSVLLILNQTTAETTFVSEITGLPLPEASNILTLETRPRDGVFYTIYDSGLVDSILATITTSGQLSTIGPTDDDVRIFALAFLNPNTQRPIPTLSQYGLILTAVLIMLAALIIIRRRGQMV